MLALYIRYGVFSILSFKFQACPSPLGHFPLETVNSVPLSIFNLPIFNFKYAYFDSC